MARGKRLHQLPAASTPLADDDLVYVAQRSGGRWRSRRARRADVSGAALPTPTAGPGQLIDNPAPGLARFSARRIYAPTAGNIDGPDDGVERSLLIDPLVIDDLTLSTLDVSITYSVSVGQDGDQLVVVMSDGVDTYDLTSVGVAPAGDPIGFGYVKIERLSIMGPTDVIPGLLTATVMHFTNDPTPTVVEMVPVVLFGGPFVPTTLDVVYRPAGLTAYTVIGTNLIGSPAVATEST